MKTLISTMIIFFLLLLPIHAFQTTTQQTQFDAEFTVNEQSYIQVDGIWYTNYRNTGNPGDRIFPTRVIAKLAGDTQPFPASELLGQSGLPAVEALHIGWGLYVYELADDANGFAAATLLASRGYLVSFDSQGTFHGDLTNDPRNPDQWSLESELTCFDETDYFETDINVRDAWDPPQGSPIYGNPDVIVGIVDGGFQVDHPDLIGNLFLNEAEVNGEDDVDDDGNGFIDDYHGWDFAGDDNNVSGSDHGTKVAGIIAAQRNNHRGIAGIAGGNGTSPGVRWLPTVSGRGMFSEIYAGVYYSIEMGADVINLSLGFNDFQAAAAEAHRILAATSNAVFVCAVGNGRIDPTSSQILPIDYPAALPETIAVNVVTCQGRFLWDTFREGDEVDIAAPGGVWTTTNGPDSGAVCDAANECYVNLFAQTSAATPHVAGTVALMLSANPGLSTVQVMDALKQTAVRAGFLKKGNQIDPINYDRPGAESLQLGAGLVDAGAAVVTAAGLLSIKNVNYSQDFSYADVLIPNQPVTLSWETHSWDGSRFKVEAIDNESLETVLIADQVIATSLTFELPADFSLRQNVSFKVSSSSQFRFIYAFSSEAFNLGDPELSCTDALSGCTDEDLDLQWYSSLPSDRNLNLLVRRVPGGDPATLTIPNTGSYRLRLADLNDLVTSNKRVPHYEFYLTLRYDLPDRVVSQDVTVRFVPCAD